MRVIEFDDPHRQKHFEFFLEMSNPHFSLCAPVDISQWLPRCKKGGYRFNRTMVYAVSAVANAMPRFRQRIRGRGVVEHDVVHPSYTIPTQASSVFSFCTVPFQPHFEGFHQHAHDIENALQSDPSFEDEEHRDDYLFLSAIPWVSFTGFQHPMHVPAQDSVPRIVWGKHYKDGDRILIPIGVQAHHSIVDGSDIGRYFQRLQQLLDKPPF